MKTTADRIVYYIRKSAQYSASKRRRPHRYNRLIAYKAELTRRAEEERNKPLW